MDAAKFLFVTLLFLIPQITLTAQSADTLAIYYYKQGLSAVNKKDFDSAKDLFKKSLGERENAPAEYELAKVYRADTSQYYWNISREHIKNAIKLDPNNVDYHLYFGLLSEDLSKISFIEFNAEDDAIREYQKTLELDSTNFTAAERLGGIEAKLFLENNNSIQADASPNSNTVIPLEDYIRLGKVQIQQYYEYINHIGTTGFQKVAEKNFKIAESAFLTAIKYDSLNPKPYLSLSSIYEDNGEPLKGIKYLQKLTRFLPGSKDAHLYLALLYYRSSQLDSAYYEYQRAIALMSESERQDFVYNSVIVLLKSYLKDKMEDMSENSLSQLIDLFWRARDPLNLSPYNARLLEHYTRVAYANLRFSVPKLGITGWKTDRGTITIRYGIPPKKYRIRTSIIFPKRGFSRTKIQPKTEIWIYPDKVFSFTDQFRNGEYIYGIPGQTQYWDDTQQFAKELEVTQPEEYHPEFEGPVFTVLNNAAQFKDFSDSNSTDIYISYCIPELVAMRKADKGKDGNSNPGSKYTLGIFLFDRYFNMLAERKDTASYFNRQNKIEIPDSGKYFINTGELTSLPDSGNLSFELLRAVDKGVATSRGRFKVRNFNISSLQMSDIVPASQVTRDSKIAGRINRLVTLGKGYSILPNPTGIFSEDQELYIYYEVYNLTKDSKGLTDFQQTIILKKKGEEGISIGKIVGSVLKFVGINKGEQQIGLTSKYQTKDKDSQIYLQMDMSGYDAGDYVLTVKIKDNISGKEASESTNLKWR